jgi:tetratricopeptide (TPR) repeat protein
VIIQSNNTFTGVSFILTLVLSALCTILAITLRVHHCSERFEGDKGDAVWAIESHRLLDTAPDEDLADAYQELGNASFYANDLHAAWNYFSRAVDTVNSTAEASSCSRISLLEDYACRRQEVDEFNEAEKLLRQALSASMAPNAHRDCANAPRYRLLENCMYQFNYENAIPVLNQIFSERERGPFRSNDNSEKLTLLGDCAHDVGTALAVVHRHTEAIRFLRRSLEMREKLAASAAQTRTNPAFDVAASLRTLGHCLIATGKLEEARLVVARANRLTVQNALPAYSFANWEMCNLVRELNEFQRMKYTDRDKLVTPRSVFIHQFVPLCQSTWSVKYQAYERCQRDHVYHCPQRFLRGAALEATAFCRDDAREALTCFALALQSGLDDESTRYQARSLGEAISNLDKKSVREIVSELVHNADGDTARVMLLEGLFESKRLLSGDDILCKELARHYLTYASATDLWQRFTFLKKYGGSSLTSHLPGIVKDLEYFGKFGDALTVQALVVEHCRENSSRSQRKEALLKYAYLAELTNDQDGAKKVRAEASAL